MGEVDTKTTSTSHDVDLSGMNDSKFYDKTYRLTNLQNTAVKAPNDTHIIPLDELIRLNKVTVIKDFIKLDFTKDEFDYVLENIKQNKLLAIIEEYINNGKLYKGYKPHDIITYTKKSNLSIYEYEMLSILNLIPKKQDKLIKYHITTLINVLKEDNELYDIKTEKPLLYNIIETYYNGLLNTLFKIEAKREKTTKLNLID